MRRDEHWRLRMLGDAHRAGPSLGFFGTAESSEQTSRVRVRLKTKRCHKASLARYLSAHGTKPTATTTISFARRAEVQDHGVHETELRRPRLSCDNCRAGAGGRRGG